MRRSDGIRIASIFVALTLGLLGGPRSDVHSHPAAVRRCGPDRACTIALNRRLCREHPTDGHACRIWRRHEPQAHVAGDLPSGPWLKVAVCEEGGRNDPTFGFLGILVQTWEDYGGTMISPTAGGA